MNQNNRSRSVCNFVFLAGASLSSMLALVPAAYAQDATVAENQTGVITVTARRSEERLQDVPVAVAAFDAEALAERRISSEVDLQFAQASLYASSGKGPGSSIIKRIPSFPGSVGFN